MTQPGWRLVPLAPTIIEGCGAIEAEADLSVWIADPGEDERRQGARARVNLRLTGGGGLTSLPRGGR